MIPLFLMNGATITICIWMEGRLRGSEGWAVVSCSAVASTCANIVIGMALALMAFGDEMFYAMLVMDIFIALVVAIVLTSVLLMLHKDLPRHSEKAIL